MLAARLESLKSLGLATVLVSISPFHNEHIPFCRVKGVIAACRRTGVAAFPWTNDFYREIDGFERPGRPIAWRRIRKNSGPITCCASPPATGFISGAGLKDFPGPLRDPGLYRHPLPEPPGLLRTPGRAPFSPGSLRPLPPGLCSGLAIRRDDLGAPLSPEKYPLLSILFHSGINGLYAAAAGEYGFKPVARYLSKCDLCLDIRRFLVLDKIAPLPSSCNRWLFMKTCDPSGGTLDPQYHGFEQGPIRPPSEAESLLLRVTRNCPWNRCKFCPVYKGTEFSFRRPVDHVKRDIDAVYRPAAGEAGDASRPGEPETPGPGRRPGTGDGTAGARSFSRTPTVWCSAPDLVEILRHLKTRFPGNAAPHLLCPLQHRGPPAAQDLAALRAAGLNRLHLGLESGRGRSLAPDAQRHHPEEPDHRRAQGQRRGDGAVGILHARPGGAAALETHARQTAAALNLINPDFIRLRTLAIPRHLPSMTTTRPGAF